MLRRTLTRTTATILILVPVLAAAAAGISVPLFYATQAPPDGSGELDSVALWVGPNPDASLLFVTDKTKNRLEVHSPVSNTFLGILGGTGAEPGKFKRPNSVLVAHGVPSLASGPQDLLFVVERDNARVSYFLLPFMFYLGSFGTGTLDSPMGIAQHWDNGQLSLWITDVGPSPQRVYVYDIVAVPHGFSGVLDFSFAPGGGATLESIAVDPVAQRVLVCDEGSNADIMVFDLQGRFIRRFGAGRFVNDPEGIALFDLGDGHGYWVVSDQNATPVEFEVFDRKSLSWITSFSGPTEGTDGVVLTQEPLANLPGGSFYAVHLDRSVHAYHWADIAAATRLCPGPPCVTEAADPAHPPRALQLSAHPNPFNPSTTIRYGVDVPGRVFLAVHDAAGRRLATLVDAQRDAGVHTTTWNGRTAAGERAPSGTYFLAADVSGRRITHKITLLQ